MNSMSLDHCGDSGTKIPKWHLTFMCTAFAMVDKWTIHLKTVICYTIRIMHHHTIWRTETERKKSRTRFQLRSAFLTLMRRPSFPSGTKDVWVSPTSSTLWVGHLAGCPQRWSRGPFAPTVRIELNSGWQGLEATDDEQGPVDFLCWLSRSRDDSVRHVRLVQVQAPCLVFMKPFHQCHLKPYSQSCPGPDGRSSASSGSSLCNWLRTSLLPLPGQP